MPTTVTTPDDLTPINAAIADLQARVTKLEQGSGPSPTPDNTWITAAGSPSIVDDSLNVYTLVDSSAAGKGLQIAKNAVVDPPTQNVVKLGILHRKVHQENAAGSWYVDNQVGNTTATAWAQEADPTAPATGKFQVSGGQILGPSGAPFRAKGVNVNYTQVWGNHGVDVGRVNRSCLQRAFPGINFVRFACWGGALAAPGDPTVTAWINDLTNNGIVVMIDLHYTGNAISPSDPTANNWFAGWARQYANNPMVWFDTQNEPHGSGISAMMLGQYNAIRGAGNGNIVLLCTGNPGGEITGMSPSDLAQMTNVGFDSHYYGWMPSNGIPWSSILSELSAFSSKNGPIPVLCCETGDSTDGNTRDSNWQQVLQASLSNPAGFACWYMNWDSSGADLLLASPYDGSALTDYGSVVANAIKTG